MHKLKRKIRNPNHLVTFEASARHLSFTQAAVELNLSRVAVSQQIKALEEGIGVQLFHRLHRSLRLTNKGSRLYQITSSSLEKISDVVDEICLIDTSNQVTITTSTGFSTYWLLPNIGDFRNQYSQIDLRFLINDTYINLDEEEVDIAIRYGDYKHGNYHTTFLAREVISPVCSPSYTFKRGAPRDPADLLNEDLIQLDGSYDAQTRWESWFEQQGINSQKIARGMSVNTYVNLVQATLDGQGISLSGSPLLDRYLESGALIYVLDILPIERNAFYLMTPKGKPISAPASLLCNWICAQFSVPMHSPAVRNG